jgi:hypothetical protein
LERRKRALPQANLGDVEGVYVQNTKSPIHVLQLTKKTINPIATLLVVMMCGVTFKLKSGLPAKKWCYGQPSIAL